MRYAKAFPGHTSRRSREWSTPHMLDQYTAAMEAEEGAIESFKGYKPFGS